MVAYNALKMAFYARKFPGGTPWLALNGLLSTKISRWYSVVGQNGLEMAFHARKFPGGTPWLA